MGGTWKGENNATWWRSTKNPGSASRQLEATIEARFYFRLGETIHMPVNKVALYIAMGKSTLISSYSDRFMRTSFNKTAMITIHGVDLWSFDFIA